MQHDNGGVRAGAGGLEQITDQPCLVIFALKVDGPDLSCERAAEEHGEGSEETIQHAGYSL